MSYRLYPIAWEAILPATAKLVLLKLIDHAADDGTSVRPSVATIARACGLTSRSVTSALGTLRSAGILILVREADPSTKRPREYHIDLDCLKSLSGDHEGGNCFTPEAASPLNDVPRPLNDVPATPEGDSPKSILEPFNEPKSAAQAALARGVEDSASSDEAQFDLPVEMPGTVYSLVSETAPVPVDPKKALYDFGRSILGASSGGQVTNLLKNHCGDLGAVERTLRLAAAKSDAREYVGAILRGEANARHEDVVAQIDENYRRWSVQ